MKTLSVSLAALAVAGMTAIPAGAQTTLPPEEPISAIGEPDRTVAATLEKRYYGPDRDTYAILDEDRELWVIFDADDNSFVRTVVMSEYEPYEPGLVEVEFVRDMDLSAYGEPDRKLAKTMEKRYYTEDRSSYAIFDPVKSVWNVFDATTDAFVEALPEGEYEPYAEGYEEVRFVRNDNLTAYDEPARGVAQSLQAGMAEERYYDADRDTYAVWDDERNLWVIYDADSETQLRTATKAEYTRYEPGYTVVIPGDVQTGMSIEADMTGESIGAETDGISDNRE